MPSAIDTRYFLSLAFAVALFCLVYVIYNWSQDGVGEFPVCQSDLDQLMPGTTQQAASDDQKPLDEFDQLKRSQTPQLSAKLADSEEGMNRKSSAVEAFSEALSEKPGRKVVQPWNIRFYSKEYRLLNSGFMIPQIVVLASGHDSKVAR